MNVMVIIKVILIFLLGIVVVQDIKERQVYWFLFPIVALCVAALHYYETLSELFYISIFINVTFVSILLLIVFLYAKFKLKTTFNNTFGLGDVFFFFAIAFSFSSISFIFIFISALIFSLILHLILKKKNSTVPLAGYMSIFFGLTYLGFWFDFVNDLYQV